MLDSLIILITSAGVVFVAIRALLLERASLAPMFGRAFRRPAPLPPEQPQAQTSPAAASPALAGRRFLKQPAPGAAAKSLTSRRPQVQP